MHPNLPTLHNLCCSDVLTRFEKKKSFALGSTVLVALIPTAVQSTIDLVVSAGGPGIKSLVDSAKPEIRQFVSNSAVKYLESVLAGLEDVKAAEGEPEAAAPNA